MIEKKVQFKINSLILIFILFNVLTCKANGSLKINKKFLNNLYKNKTKIYVTSKLKDKDNKYSSKNLIDGNADTCWATSKNGGQGEKILIFPRQFCTKPYSTIKGIILNNGYIKNHNLYLKNNRIKKLKIDIYRIIVIPLEGGEITWTTHKIKHLNTISKKLHDKFLTSQKIEFNIDLEKDYKKTLKKEHITPDYLFVLTIEDIYKGSEHNDLCVSEIKFMYKK